MSYPSSAEHHAAWGMGLVWCSWHHGWVAIEEGHRQMGCPNAVWCCRECIESDDAREKRPAPEAVIELRKVALPDRLGRLWAMMEDEE